MDNAKTHLNSFQRDYGILQFGVALPCVPSIALWRIWEALQENGYKEAILRLEALERQPEPNLAVTLHTKRTVEAVLPKILETPTETHIQNMILSMKPGLTLSNLNPHEILEVWLMAIRVRVKILTISIEEQPDSTLTIQILAAQEWDTPSLN
jgi:hypothetical protein